MRAALLLALGLSLGAQGQQRPTQNFFQPDAAARSAAAASPLAATLIRARTQALSLDEPGLRAALATAPPEGRAGAAPLELALPRPDGTSARFALREAPVMDPALAARYHQIKTYAGVGLDDATATVRLDLTPQGFHAQVLSDTGPGFLIDPARPTDTRHYLSYSQQDARASASPAARCQTVSTPAQQQASAARVAAWRGAGGGPAPARLSGAQLRTYRFTLSATPEFSAACGNTTAGVQAVEAMFMNRMNGIFERELAVRLLLVANNDQLIFLNGIGPKPPFSYSDGTSAAGQNQKNVDKLIGDANYDLGLVLTFNGGGGTWVSNLSQSGYKADGMAGHPVPTEYQLVYYAAHEVGHMLGANHTFNAIDSNNGNAPTAWEPGAGVTLMSYCGSYGPDNNVQSKTEITFHTGSYEQMQAVMSKCSCGTLTATGNTAPVVTAPASGKTLPLNTPFKLTATATDAENDPLTYSWEELDTGPAGNLSLPQVTGKTPPLFRVFPPTTSTTRYFPRLAGLATNTATPATGERLPTVARTLTFRCTARDLHNGPAGGMGGVDYSALVKLDVSAAAGPFVVTAPNAAGTSWAGGSTQTVSWNVANTTAAPVNCAKVNLRLSLDGGLTYPLTLATGVANSGTASVTVPNVATTTARVMVEAADNYFFAISGANFAITPGPGPTIISFSPALGPVGTKVTLTGTNLAGATEVRLNGTPAAITGTPTATSLTVTVDPGSTSGLLTVRTPAGTGSSATPFLVGSPPTITGFTPTRGLVSAEVRLTGTNFLGTTQLTLNNVAVPATNFSVNSDTQLTFAVPDGATTGLLALTTPFGTATSTGEFIVPMLPVITSFTPTTGPVGTTTVVLTGRNFTGATQVGFGGVVAKPAPGGSDTQLTVAVPIGARSGPLSVTTPAGTGVSGGSFTVVSPPVLTAMNPTRGPAGALVVLTGTTLDQAKTVTLNGSSVPFTLVSATTITFVVPTTATTGLVAAVASNGASTSAGTFTVLPAAPGLAITGIVPASAPTEATIRLTGTGFTGAALVTFPGRSANTVSSADFTVNAAGTELTAKVPTGALTGVLTVALANGSGGASAQVFTVCALPAAQAQNTRLVLGPTGTATLAPTAVNNGSTANCGVAAAPTLSVVPNAFTTADIGPAVVARALRLNGNGQYVAIGSSATVPTGNSNYTIEAWIKPTTMGGNSIIGWGAFGNRNMCNALRLSAKGLVNYWWGNDIEVATPSLAGAWHHVAATFDGTTRTLYLDGKAIGTDQPDGGHNVPNAQNLRIGSTNSGEFFNGSIDEVRVWNVARTAAQLSSDRGLHLLRTPAGLVACYPFGEGSGTATADANGVAANAGTLTGGAGWDSDAPALTNGVPVVLTVTDAGNHTTTAPAVVTVLAGTATATTAANATAFSVWPNPVGAKGTLHVSLTVPASAARATLRNALGQLVRTRAFADSTTELPTAGLAPGLYLLSVQADGYAPTMRRVVVE